ncbi:MULTISPECIES: hypothetical protein [unclassified Gilliamella]|uniref:hypothetical protein n=1 Tax=unclassified Gilliamella TaxID=2685620 RepID=UPI00130228F6|nr:MULTISPECIES: hypothetical protein [unclassified Gilliamella]
MPINSGKDCDDLMQLAEDLNIDIVYNANSNSLDFSQAKLTLEHDQDVICEKTLTLNY